MNEDEFDYELLKNEVINQMNTTFSIDEALEINDVRIKNIKENFKQTWENYHIVDDTRKNYVNKINITRFQMFFSFFLSSLINNDIGLEVDSLINKLKSSSLEINKQKEILILIKKALKKLEKNLVVDCNYDICELLELLYQKENILFNQVIHYIKISSAKISRINIIPSDKNIKDLDDINELIDMYVLKLGLK